MHVKPDLSFYVEVFTQNRFMIVVNKIDLVNGEGSKELTPEKVITSVYEFVKAKCESHEEIPKSIVVPVSALWAYNARMFLQDPNSYKEDVKMSLRYCQPCGEISQLESGQELVTLAKKLVDHSNIVELEKRYNNSSSVFLLIM
jgi:hypothetical protein